MVYQQGVPAVHGNELVSPNYLIILLAETHVSPAPLPPPNPWFPFGLPLPRTPSFPLTNPPEPRASVCTATVYVTLCHLICDTVIHARPGFWGDGQGEARGSGEGGVSQGEYCVSFKELLRHHNLYNYKSQVRINRGSFTLISKNQQSLTPPTNPENTSHF